jgi:hypothetical protein
LPTNLNNKKMPHPHSHVEKEGGVGKGLRTTIEESIVITNVTKKTHLFFHLRGCDALPTP